MSEDALFSEHWHRVRQLRPSLAADVVAVPHRYRGVPWYVLYRASSSSHFRVRAVEFDFIQQLDGSRSVESLWQDAVAERDAQAPTQAQLISLLAQLHEADLLNVDRRLSVDRLFARRSEAAHAETTRRYLNPLFLRLPLLDPDRLLGSLAPVGQMLFGRIGACAWLLLSTSALLQLIPRWSQLRYEFGGLDLLSPEAGISVLLVFPVIKLLHELGHGLAVKRYGGEVHEMGISLLVLLPVPYVDASAATAFEQKSARVVVGAAGILVELAIAALAALVWAASEPGLVHDVALTVMLIGGVSTVLFNGNPLLKFDGYYVLADAVEIPNLAERSRRYVLGRLERGLLGAAVPVELAEDPREALWLWGYAVASSVYRLVLMFTIAWMLMGRFFFFGVALAAWVVAVQIGVPAWRLAVHLRHQPPGRRPRIAAISLGLAAGVLVVFVFLPLPLNTVATGIVWLPDDAIVRPAVDCEVVEVLTRPGATVAPDEPLFRCGDDELQAEVLSAQGRLDERSAERAGLSPGDRVGRQALERELSTLSRRVERLREQQQALLVRSGAAGRFVPAHDTSLAGRRLAQGEIAAFIVPPEQRSIRIALRQAQIGDLERGVNGVEVRLVEEDRRFDTRVLRQTPKADVTLPSAALTRRGGGDLPADPGDPDGLTSREPVFELQLAWPGDAPRVQVGGHVHVKFRHAPEPLSRRLLSDLRRAFLQRLDA